jgi:hypothetical protein
MKDLVTGGFFALQNITAGMSRFCENRAISETESQAMFFLFWVSAGNGC